MNVCNGAHHARIPPAPDDHPVETFLTRSAAVCPPKPPADRPPPPCAAPGRSGQDPECGERGAVAATPATARARRPAPGTRKPNTRPPQERPPQERPPQAQAHRPQGHQARGQRRRPQVRARPAAHPSTGCAARGLVRPPMPVRPAQPAADRCAAGSASSRGGRPSHDGGPRRTPPAQWPSRLADAPTQRQMPAGERPGRGVRRPAEHRHLARPKRNMVVARAASPRRRRTPILPRPQPHVQRHHRRQPSRDSRG